jgi:hypothetical protein
MRLFAKTFSMVILGILSVAARADPLNFLLTGEGKTYSWSLDSNPTPAPFEVSSETDFYLPMTVNGQSTEAFMYFSVIEVEGGVGIVPLDVNNSVLYLFGPQLFSGTVLAPEFAPGIFALHEFDQPDRYTLAISREGDASAVPEPTSLLLWGTGLMGWFAIRRRLPTGG